MPKKIPPVLKNPDLSVSLMIASAADLSELMSGHSVEDVIDVLLNESRLHLPRDLKRVHGPTDGPYTTREEIEPDMQAKASMEAIAFNGKVRQAHEAGDVDGVFFYTAQLISAVIRSRAHNTHSAGANSKAAYLRRAEQQDKADFLKVFAEHKHNIRGMQDVKAVPLLASYFKKYKGKKTIRGWIAEEHPDLKFKPGRPKKK